MYLLLLHTPGAKEWADLRRVPGMAKPTTTFREAVVQRGLIDDDKERLVLCRLMMRPCFVIGSNPMVRQFLCGPPQHTADDPPEQHNNGKWTISFN